MVCLLRRRPGQAGSDIFRNGAGNLPSQERPAGIDTRQALDWSEIYYRLADDPSDSLAWIGLSTWVSLWARKALGGWGAAAIEDAVADTCASIVHGFAKARGAETFSGFAYGQFLNVRQRLVRRRLVSVQPLDAIDVPDDVPDRPAPDEIALLRKCLAELAQRERRAVELRYFEDAPADQIAATLGVTVVNARRIVFNGLAHLRACAQRTWPHGR